LLGDGEDESNVKKDPLQNVLDIETETDEGEIINRPFINTSTGGMNNKPFVMMKKNSGVAKSISM